MKWASNSPPRLNSRKFASDDGKRQGSTKVKIHPSSSIDGAQVKKYGESIGGVHFLLAIDRRLHKVLSRFSALPFSRDGST